MLKNCPDPVDVQDLQFKLQCRLKIFDNKDLNVFKSSSLLSCASRYGLLFVGSNCSSLQVIQIKCVENYSPKDKDVSNYPRRLISLPSSPKHISINCDSSILAVVIEKEQCATVVFYEVLSFLKQNIIVIKEVRLSPTSGVYITETNWNPALPTIFTACKSDGTLGVYEIQDNSISINELPAAAEAISFCWSPKGKQIAVGSRNGKITQYKPDLKAVKAINEPPLQGIYQDGGSECSAKLIVVDAPKTGQMSYTNYEDVCYSGNSRPSQFYMTFQQQWNILLVASANSTELGVLANTGDTWTQCIISDSARAELPLNSDHQETLPIGLALDISSTTPLPWNESSIPPCPYLLILSHEGILCIFNVVNLKEGIPSICTPPDSISDVSGISHFVVPSETEGVEMQKNLLSAPESKEPPFAFALSPNISTTQGFSIGTNVLTQPQPTYATPTSLFGTKTSETKGLFGGQAVLTPINPQQPTTQTPLFGGQTLITPINKLPTTTSGPTTTSSDKYASIFSAVSTPISTSVTIQTKPIIISTPTATKSEYPVHQEIVNSKSTPSSVPPADSKMTINLKVKGEKDALLAHMISDECHSLETELKKMLHQGKFSKIDVGTENEKFDLITKIESLQEFVKEIVDISIGENAEVHYLKQNLIQCWAWFEEARSRYNSSKDTTLSLLLKSQPLDSATEKRQQDITKLMYYIETQISQASKALDEQWDNFQDYAKKTHRTKMPTMETIFQTMVRQNAVLQKQSYILKDIANRLKSKSRTNKGPSLLLALENTNDIEDNLKQLHLNHSQDIHQLRYERVLKRMKNLSTSKTKKLRDLLKTREVHHVTVVKPQLSSSVVLQSPESKSKRLISNLLALSTQVSPVAKSSALARQLNFVHSTPIREPSIDAKPTEAPPNTPQIDSKTFSFKKVEKNSTTVSVTTAINFAQSAKSTSVFSNLTQNTTSQSTLPTHSLSAFVPTTQITFSASGKAFNFTPAVTTSTTILKTDAAGTVSAMPAFSLGNPTPALSKFGMVTVPKTTSLVTSSSIPKTTTPITKTTLPQFNFGNSISITPVTIPKKSDSSVPTTMDVATSKSAFTFGGTSIFSSKIEPSTTNKIEAVTPVSNSSLFGNSPQTSKSVFGPASTSTFSFGAVSGTSKPSAFTAVTTMPLTATAISIAKSDIIVTTNQPLFTNNIPTATPLFGNTSVASTTSITTTSTSSQISLFRDTDAITKPQSFFETTSTVSLTTSTSSLATSSTPLFSNLTVVTKPSPVFASTPIAIQSDNTLSTSLTTSCVTSSVSSIFSMPTKTSVNDAENLKPSVTNIGSGLVSPVTSTSDTSQSMSIFSASITGTTKPSFFGATTETTIFGTSISSSKSIFSSAPTSSSSIFGASLPAITTTPILITPATTPTTTGSIFAQTTGSQPSLLGKCTSPNSIFGNTLNTTTAPLFGASSVNTATTSPFSTTQAPIFGSTAVTHPAVFGTTGPVTTISSIFGGTTTTQSSTSGTPISSATTKPAMFGSTQPSIFGSTAPISTQQSSIFGGATNTNPTSILGAVSSTPPSVFGATSSTTKPAGFGATTSVSVSQPSMFTATSVSSTQPSPFSPSTVASPFGSSFNTVTSVASSSSSFGQSTPIFGSPKTTEGPFGSTFGSSSVFGSTPATTASAFGQPATFGSNSQSVFGTPTTSTNIFGSAATNPTFGVSSSANVFGSPPASSSSFSFAGTNNAANTGSFGFGGLNVGNTATTSGSIFGGGTTFASATPQVNPFGRTTEQKSPFASNSNIFGSPVSSSSSVFGSGSVFGSNTQSGFGTSTFGASSTFGQQSAFGQHSFGNTSFGSTPGAFSGSGGGVGQTGFGSPTSYQKPSGFGSSPVFGGSPQPAFGAAPSFGGAPAFGTTPFGSPNKVFGSNTTTGFGSATTGNAGFGNLANQNTIGFGNLAQQAASSSTSPFSGSSSFSSWR